MTVTDRLLNRSLEELALRVYQFSPGVLHFNHRSPLRILITFASVHLLAANILNIEAANPQRRELLLQRIAEVHARPEDQGRSTPLEMTVIHGSHQLYNILRHVMLQVVTDETERRDQFASLIDYAIRFSPALITPILNDAREHAQMSPTLMVEYLLRSGYFSSAGRLFRRFRQQRNMTQNDLIDAIVGAFGHYVEAANEEQINRFFSATNEWLIPLNSQEGEELQDRLINEVLMDAVTIEDTPEHPNRHANVSILLETRLSGRMTAELRDLAQARAVESGQVTAATSLMLMNFEGRFWSSSVEPEEEAYPEPGPSHKKPRYE